MQELPLSKSFIPSFMKFKDIHLLNSVMQELYNYNGTELYIEQNIHFSHPCYELVLSKDNIEIVNISSRIKNKNTYSYKLVRIIDPITKKKFELNLRFGFGCIQLLGLSNESIPEKDFFDLDDFSFSLYINSILNNTEIEISHKVLYRILKLELYTVNNNINLCSLNLMNTEESQNKVLGLLEHLLGITYE